MSRSSTTGKAAVLSVAVLGASVTLTAPAYAYIDPGSAGIALQAIVGAFAAGLVTLKLYSHRIKNFFFHSKTVEAETNDKKSGPTH